MKYWEKTLAGVVGVPVGATTAGGGGATAPEYHICLFSMLHCEEKVASTLGVTLGGAAGLETKTASSASRPRVGRSASGCNQRIEGVGVEGDGGNAPSHCART